MQACSTWSRDQYHRQCSTAAAVVNRVTVEFSRRPQTTPVPDLIQVMLIAAFGIV